MNTNRPGTPGTAVNACPLCTSWQDTHGATLGAARHLPTWLLPSLTHSPTTRGAPSGCCGLKQHPNIVVAMESRHNPHHLLTAPPQLFAQSPLQPWHSAGTPWLPARCTASAASPRVICTEGTERAVCCCREGSCREISSLGGQAATRTTRAAAFGTLRSLSALVPVQRSCRARGISSALAPRALCFGVRPL